jgi:hypothetical protein
MSKTKPQLWFASDTSGLALWDENHSFFKDGAEIRVVETQFGSVNVKIPARLGNTDLANTVAIGAAYFKGGFLRAHRDLPYLYTESVAQSYVRLGGTAERWLTNLANMGITPDPRADNFFVTYLRALDGNRPDPHSRLGRWGRFLDRWVALWRPGPALGDPRSNSDDYGFPDPLLHGDDLPGSSDFVLWAKHMDGIEKIAARHGKWLRQRNCLRCGFDLIVADDPAQVCPNCKRPVHDLDPHDGDARVVGVRPSDPGSNEIVHAEHWLAERWLIECYSDAPVVRDGAWVALPTFWYNREEAEAEALRLRAENYSESISANTPEGTVATTVGGGTVVKFPRRGETRYRINGNDRLGWWLVCAEPGSDEFVTAPGAQVFQDVEEAVQTAWASGIVLDGDPEIIEATVDDEATADEAAGQSDDGESDQSGGDDNQDDSTNEWSGGELRRPLRKPPRFSDSWDDARKTYHISAPSESSQDTIEYVPPVVDRWLSGEEPDPKYPREADTFAALDAVGPNVAGELRQLCDFIVKYDEHDLAKALDAVANDGENDELEYDTHREVHRVLRFLTKWFDDNFDDPDEED